MDSLLDSSSSSLYIHTYLPICPLVAKSFIISDIINKPSSFTRCRRRRRRRRRSLLLAIANQV